MLKSKNPYLFRAKNLLVAADLIRVLLDAHLSSQEETLFGGFLERLAIFVCEQTFGGRKSAVAGIDLEFEREALHYLVSIKSGPHWGNKSQIEKMRDYFKKARQTLATNTRSRAVAFINGCCYGQGDSDYGDYRKLCGQSFWTLISGDEELYIKIIEPLGHQAKEQTEAFQEQYAAVANLFTAEFAQRFCLSSGAIDWDTLVQFNSGQR